MGFAQRGPELLAETSAGGLVSDGGDIQTGRVSMETVTPAVSIRPVLTKEGATAGQ